MPVYSLITDSRHGSTMRSLTPLRNRVRTRNVGGNTLMTLTKDRSASQNGLRSAGAPKPSLHESILMDSLAADLGLENSMRIIAEQTGKEDYVQLLDNQLREINTQITSKASIDMPQYSKSDFYGMDKPKDGRMSYFDTSLTVEPGFCRSPVSMSNDYRHTRTYVDNQQRYLNNKPFPELLQFNQGDISEYNPMGVYSSCSIIRNRALAQSSYNPDLFPDSMIERSASRQDRVLSAPRNNERLYGPLRYNTEYETGDPRVDLGSFNRGATIRSLGNIMQNATASSSQPLTTTDLFK